MGRSHAMALRELGLKLSAVCDTRQHALDIFGLEFDVPANRRFTEAAMMFGEFDHIDLVIVATTSDTHCDLTCKAAEASARAILCEKPMAVSLAQCDQMLSACKRSGSCLAINHQMRFMAHYQMVKSVVDKGKLGRLASMNVVAGCFGLAMNGSHYIEAFNYLTGSFPIEASAWFSGDRIGNPRGPNFFDQAGEFRFLTDNAERLNLAIGHDQGHGMTAIYAGAYGHIFVDELEGEAIITSRKPEHREMQMTRYGMPWDRVKQRFAPADNVRPTKAVIAALMDGNNYPDGQAGRRIVASVVACYASAENGGGPIRLSDNEAMTDRIFDWA